MQGPGEATAHRLSDLAWAFHLPDDVLHIEDPVVGVFDELFYAITELAEMAERAFAAA